MRDFVAVCIWKQSCKWDECRLQLRAAINWNNWIFCESLVVLYTQSENWNGSIENSKNLRKWEKIENVFDFLITAYGLRIDFNVIIYYLIYLRIFFDFQSRIQFIELEIEQNSIWSSNYSLEIFLILKFLLRIFQFSHTHTQSNCNSSELNGLQKRRTEKKRSEESFCEVSQKGRRNSFNDYRIFLLCIKAFQSL